MLRSDRDEISGLVVGSWLLVLGSTLWERHSPTLMVDGWWGWGWGEVFGA